MSNIAKIAPKGDLLESVLIQGDLAKLSQDQRVDYYNRVCTSIGLNPLTRPFEYITLNGKLTLYARRDATDQLRMLYKVSIKITARELMGDVYVVTAQASMPDGRCDESTGAVTIKGLVGDNLANAYLKCETKAKRRVSLSICGLGMLDESEKDSLPSANKSKQVTEVLDASQPSEEPIIEEPLMESSVAHCETCGSALMLSKAGTGYYCPKFKDTSEGEHTRFPVHRLAEFLKEQVRS